MERRDDSAKDGHPVWQHQDGWPFKCKWVKIKDKYPQSHGHMSMANSCGGCSDQWDGTALAMSAPVERLPGQSTTRAQSRGLAHMTFLGTKMKESPTQEKHHEMSLSWRLNPLGSLRELPEWL